MSEITNLTRFAMVQHSHTEEGVWRAALGGFVPLRVAVTDGPLDAPDHLPAGSMVHHRLGGATRTTTPRNA